jgi:DNA-binding transcriptional LysR family regulator
MARTQAEDRSYAGSQTGTIRLGRMPALTRSLMGPVLRRFMREQPNLTITAVEAVSTELVERVKAGELDVAIVPVFDAPPSLRCRAVGSSPEVVVGRGRRHPQHMRPVSLAKLGSLKLILQSPGNMRRERILAHLRAQGVEIASLLDLDSMFGTLEYAEASDYLTVLPAIMVLPEIEQATLCVRPIKDKGFILDMMAIEAKRNARSPSIDTLIEAFAEQLMDWPASKRPHGRS